MKRFKEQWRKLASGLYVPPLLRLGHWYHGVGRCCCDGKEQFCNVCFSISMPTDFLIVPTGPVGDQPGDCSTLLPAEGYIVTNTPSFICFYNYDIDPPVLDIIRVRLVFGNIYSIQVVLVSETIEHLWSEDWSPSFKDCKSFDEEPVGNWRSPGAHECDFTGIGWTVTSI